MVSSERPRFVSRTILFEREVRARKVSYSTTRHGTRLVHLHLTDVDAALGDRGAAWSILASTLSPDALLDKYGSEKALVGFEIGFSQRGSMSTRCPRASPLAEGLLAA